MKNNNIKKIFICATEQSGDNIGSYILQKLDLSLGKDNIYISGVGGSKMEPYMNKQLYSLENFKTIGIIEILFSLHKYIYMINKLSKYINNNNFDLIITIDSPDFNYPLCKKIKKNNFKNKIIHIVAPTVWAWRKNRAKKFSNVFNELFTLFKFENKYFEKYGLKTTCIGHPIYHIENNWNKSKTKNQIALLPGSRLGEINSLFKYFQICYEHIRANNIELNIFIPTLPHLKNEILKRTKEWKIKVTISDKKDEIDSYFSNTKIAIVCSGTASLEIAKRGIPQLVIYKLNLFTELILKLIVNVKFANLLNIFANKMIIPELVNSNLNKKLFLKELNNLLNNEKANNYQKNEVNKILDNILMNDSPYKIAANRVMLNLL